jgi:hypothetical protein
VDTPASSRAYNTIAVSGYEQISSAICFLDSDFGDYAGVSGFQFVIPRRHDANPLHDKILQRKKQTAEIATSHFHVVGRKFQLQLFSLLDVIERRGNKMLVRKNVRILRRRNFQPGEVAKFSQRETRQGERSGETFGILERLQRFLR